jgi:23S rRNA (pseudouridine1915-N3)-methyltransferase
VVLNFTKIRLIAVGKVRKGWIREGITMLLKRLPGLSILEVRDGGMEREAGAVLLAIKPDEQLVVLSEEGECLTSVKFAQKLSQLGSDRLVFVIGGAAGVDASLKAKAAWRLSLSPMTFPHELARLILLEQLYRAQSILQGGPYHRE